MATVTSRLGLVLPAYNESADVGTINSALAKLDLTAGLLLCTEGTKPTTNLFDGYYIKCTDSGKHYLSVAGSWVEDTYLTVVAYTGIVPTHIVSKYDNTTVTYFSGDGSLGNNAGSGYASDPTMFVHIADPGVYKIEMKISYWHEGANGGQGSTARLRYTGTTVAERTLNEDLPNSDYNISRPTYHDYTQFVENSYPLRGGLGNGADATDEASRLLCVAGLVTFSTAGDLRPQYALSAVANNYLRIRENSYLDVVRVA